MATAIDAIPAPAWTPAYDADGGVRDGAWVAEATGLVDLSGWPPGMRVIVRKERPHTGAQLRFTDRNGLRLTAFATNTRRGQLPDLELRHRRRARCEDRIRAAKDTGLANLPLHGFDQNRIWCAWSSWRWT
jgi:Transposase DDE domain group 1